MHLWPTSVRMWIELTVHSIQLYEIMHVCNADMPLIILLCVKI